jgi:hypothetical protein
LRIFKSRQAAQLARKEGWGPDYFKVGWRVVYPLEAIIEWLHDAKRQSTQKSIGSPKIDDKRSTKVNTGVENNCW